MPAVLIVDDDHVLRAVLRRLFEQGSGFETCVEAESVEEALHKTKQVSPKLAVLDSSLPEMNGLQLARKLKAIAPNLTIFLLTADCGADSEREALECGVTAVFSKLDDLTTLVSNARAECGIE